MGFKPAPTRTIVSILAAALMAGCSADVAKRPVVSTPSASASRSPKAILIENENTGSVAWKLPINNRITGYADVTSIEAGGIIRFAVSTARTRFNLDVFRLGWYGGLGGRLMISFEALPGSDQGHWIGKTFGVTGCATCEVDPVTGLVDANWAWSYSLTVPTSWISGVYIARLSASGGDSGSIPFIVRDDSAPATLLAVLPVNTWQAYNAWGGKSLYGYNSFGAPTMSHQENAVKVSFDRPYARAAPAPEDLNLLSFLERIGYDVSYATDTDLDGDPQLLSNNKLYIAVGHAEYWTRAMRDSVESARDHGISLAFIGGNDVYWQARYEPAADGRLRRTLVVYRSAALDPMAHVDPGSTTVTWPTPPVNRPQNALTGTIYVNGSHSSSEAWTVSSDVPAWVLNGTRLRPGDVVADLEVGECDRALRNGVSPRSLIILGTARFKTGGIPNECDTTWYVTEHNSAVFSAGDTEWPNFLGGLRSDDRIIGVTKNVVDQLLLITRPESAPSQS